MGTNDRIRVEDIMSTPLETIAADADVREAVTVMREKEIKALLVPGASTGILTSTDVLDAVAEGHDASELAVSDVMTVPVETITSHLRLEEAAAMMTSFGINHLPVVDGEGDYVGMVSSTDVTAALT